LRPHFGRLIPEPTTFALLIANQPTSQPTTATPTPTPHPSSPRPHSFVSAHARPPATATVREEENARTVKTTHLSSPESSNPQSDMVPSAFAGFSVSTSRQPNPTVSLAVSVFRVPLQERKKQQHAYT